MKIKFTRTYEADVDDDVVQQIYDDIAVLRFNKNNQKELLIEDCKNYFEEVAILVEDDLPDQLAKIADEVVK